MAKMWEGRTGGITEKLADDFNSSIRFDCKMYREDIEGSIAHASMLGKMGIITAEEAETLKAGLCEILSDIDSGKLDFDPDCEDIHMFVEQVLTERIGDVGKKLHTARSRNDQVALDLRMYLRNKTDMIQS
ncbi:MAG: argininosuccinate lyase, partial [Clostridia bacterium]|nr:argininosuccinate lyase [Clostridia bacterium]